MRTMPPSLTPGRCWRRIGRSDVIRLLEEHRSPASAETEYFLGKAYVQNGQGRTGAEILRRVYYNYPTSYTADNAAADLKKIPEAAFLPPVTYGEHERRAEGLYKTRRWSGAAEEYRAMVDLQPTNSAALIQLANSYMHDGNTRDARAALDRIPDDGSDASAEKWYQRAEIARNANDDAGLNTILEHMRATTPKSPWLESALLTAGNMYLLRKDYDRAIDYYREIHQRFPDGTKAAYTHWKCAWLTYRQNRPEQAKKYFEEQIEFYPGTNEVPNAMYWRARMAEDDKDYGLARAYYEKLADRYRNYYYGVLARKRLAMMPTAPAASVALLQRVGSARDLRSHGAGHRSARGRSSLHARQAAGERRRHRPGGARTCRPAAPTVRHGRCWKSRASIPAEANIIAPCKP